MAYREFLVWAADGELAQLVASGYEVRVYSDFDAGSLATVKIESSGATTLTQPITPNAGRQATTTVGAPLGSETNFTVDSSSGFSVGDWVPIQASGGRKWRAITAIPDATHITLESALGVAATIGATIGGPEAYAAAHGWVADSQDYRWTLKPTGGVESPPMPLYILAPTSALPVTSEGSAVVTATSIDVRGPVKATNPSGAVARIEGAPGYSRGFLGLI